MNPFLQKLAVDHHLEYWLGALDPAWSVRDLRARVLEVRDETHDVKTFVLRANRRWKGHRAGQFVGVDVEIDGVRVRRCYSIASAPAGRTFSITVKRAGRVSTWLHTNLKRGDVLRLAPPDGAFVLPSPAPDKLLLLSGGSGITPVMSILRDLANRGSATDVVFLHGARSEADVIFAAELATLARRHAWLRLVVTHVPLTADLLSALVPDYAARTTFMCGPQPMMDGLAPAWSGIEDRLTLERYAAAVVPPTTAHAKVRLTMATSETSFEIDNSESLLQQIEKAGHRPKSGCRMGICHSCVCRKKSGVIEDLTTGAVSGEPDEDIRICVSRARTDVTLSL